MKKSLKFSLILMLVLFISGTVFADTQISKDKATMVQVSDDVCDISFGKYGTFEKKMENIDLENKTIDIKLTAKNNAEAPKKVEKTRTVTGTKDADIVFLIDNSNSMSANTVSTTGLTRKQTVINATNALIDKLFEKGSNIKVGVVEYATPNTSKVGSVENDTTTVTPSFVKSASDAKAAVKKVQDEQVGNKTMTDIEAGLIAANNLLSTETNTNIKKFIVLLTDGIPNYAIGVGPTTNHIYDDTVFVPTKNKLVELKNAGVTVDSVLINLSDNTINYSTKTPQPTYKEAAQQIFGTEMNPTAGPLYYVSDANLAQTITNSIYNSLTTEYTEKYYETEGEEYSLTDIVIKDYFPDYIINNFDFALLNKPNKGEVSATVDKSDNSITWTISKLDYGETATFDYRLSLKDGFSSDILDKDLKTNKDVTIDYKENGKQGDQKHNDKCPVVKLTVEEEPETPITPPKKDEPNTVTPPDNTVVPQPKLPQTGTNTIIVLALMGLGGTIGTISYMKYRNLR